MQKLSRITGMPVKHELRFQSITRPELSNYLDARSKESLKDEDVVAEETVLKLIGFVPQDFDLRKTSLALMNEQAAAFYDYHRKALFLSDWTPDSMRDTAIIHELAHALADQNFNLGKFTRKVQNDSERSTAREAVVEGQASYLMLAYNAPRSDSQFAVMEPDRSNFDASVEPGGEDYPVFDRAPLYLRMTLVFPYTWGFGFQASVLRHFGKEGYSEVFRHPPVSSRQILHPDVYLAGEKLGHLPIPRQPHGYKTISDGELGELDHRVLIQQFVSLAEAKKLSPQWRAGVYRVVESRLDHSQRMLLYVSEWADEPSASNFFLDYRKCLEAKWQHLTFQHQESKQPETNVISGHSETGYFRVSREGRRVLSTEGSPEPL